MLVILVLLLAFVTMSWWMPSDLYRVFLYPGGKPNAFARRLNRLSDWASSMGVAPSLMVSLETRGRRTGKNSRVPLVVAQLGASRYLVSMLGETAHWVQNVRASRGEALLRHGVIEPVRLVEVAVSERAPILREYLRRAPGARPHFKVGVGASLEEFASVASSYPVFLIFPTQKKPDHL